MSIRFSLALAALLIAGCIPNEPRSSTRGVSVTLFGADSAVGEDGTYTWYHIQVAASGRLDTIRGVMTHQQPIITPNGEVLGISFDSSGQIDFAYNYAPSTHRLSRITLPKDISPYFSEAAFSPRGDRLAFIAQSPEALEAAVVTRWPDTHELARITAGPGFASDVNFNHLRWINERDAEFAIRIDADDGPWVHVRVRGDTAITVDTLKSEPSWPQR